MSLDFDSLIAAWRGPLTGWFARRGARLASSDELVADVFARAWMHRDRFEGDGLADREVGAWLVGIARNVEREARRGRTPRPLADAEPALSPASDEEATVRDEARRVRTAVDRLPDMDRALIGAFYFDGTSTARVAQLFGLSERAVEGRLRRSRECLQGWLSR